MAKAKKQKSGKWRVQAFSHHDYVDGKRVACTRSFTADTKAEAEILAAKYAADKARYESASITVGEAVDRYINNRAAVLSPSTVRIYEGQRKRLSFIEPIYVDTLTSADLQRWVSSMSMEVSAKTVRNIYSMVISAIFDYCDKKFRVTLPTRAPLEYHVPTDADVRRLMSEAPEHLRVAITLAAVGTLRRGEICGLKYKDVMWDLTAIYVHTDMVQDKEGKYIHKEFPKTSHSVRRVQLPDEVMAMLGDGDPEEYIVPLTPGTVSREFTKLCSRLGMQCRFHDLRHYAASILHAIGMPDQYIMERGGWRTDSTLKSVYRNTLSDRTKMYSDKANGYFSNRLLGDGKSKKK